MRCVVAADGEAGGGGGGGGAADVECVTDNLRGLLNLNASSDSAAGAVATNNNCVVVRPSLSADTPHYSSGLHDEGRTADITALTAHFTTDPSNETTTAHLASRNGIKASNESQGHKLEVHGHLSKPFSDNYYKSSTEIHKTSLIGDQFSPDLNNYNEPTVSNVGLDESSNSTEDWTILKDFLNFRHPQDLSRDIYVQSDNCEVRNERISCVRSGPISHQVEDLRETVLKNSDVISYQGEIKNNRPLPSINTLVRGNVELARFGPDHLKDQLQISHESLGERSLELEESFDKDQDYCRNNLVYNDRDYSPLPPSKELLSSSDISYHQPPRTPAPVDLSRTEEYRVSYRPGQLRTSSPGYTASSPSYTASSSGYTARYTQDQPYNAETSKLSELKSALGCNKNASVYAIHSDQTSRTSFTSPDLRQDSYRDDRSSGYRSPIDPLTPTLRTESPFLGSSEATSAFRTVSPSLSPGVSGEGSPRPPVSLLRDLLVLGKPVRSPPSPQHVQVRN